MKREYTKPDILFESFSLSTSIAGNCETKTDTEARGQCGLPSTGLGTIFVDTIEACTFDVEEGKYLGPGDNDGICYHAFVPTNNLFNS